MIFPDRNIVRFTPHLFLLLQLPLLLLVMLAVLADHLVVVFLLTQLALIVRRPLIQSKFKFKKIINKK